VSHAFPGPSAGELSVIADGPRSGPIVYRIDTRDGTILDSIPVWARVPQYRPSSTEIGHFFAAAMTVGGRLVLGNPREAKLVLLTAGAEPKWIAIRDLAKGLVWTDAEAGARYAARFAGGAAANLPGADSLSVVARFVGKPKPVILGSRAFAVGGDGCLWMAQSSASGPRLTRYVLDGTERGSIALTNEPTLVRQSSGGVVVAFELNTGEVRLTRVRGSSAC